MTNHEKRAIMRYRQRATAMQLIKQRQETDDARINTERRSEANRKLFPRYVAARRVALAMLDASGWPDAEEKRFGGRFRQLSQRRPAVQLDFDLHEMHKIDVSYGTALVRSVVPSTAWFASDGIFYASDLRPIEPDDLEPEMFESLIEVLERIIMKGN